MSFLINIVNLPTHKRHTRQALIAPIPQKKEPTWYLHSLNTVKNRSIDALKMGEMKVCVSLLNERRGMNTFTHTQWWECLRLIPRWIFWSVHDGSFGRCALIPCPLPVINHHRRNSEDNCLFLLTVSFCYLQVFLLTTRTRTVNWIITTLVDSTVVVATLKNRSDQASFAQANLRIVAYPLG